MLNCHITNNVARLTSWEVSMVEKYGKCQCGGRMEVYQTTYGNDYKVARCSKCNKVGPVDTNVVCLFKKID